MVGLLTAPPGTRLYDRMKKEGRIKDEFSGVNTVADTNIIPKMDMGELVDGYQKVVHGIYHPKNFYRRVRIFLENYQPRGLHKSRVTAAEISAFFRACILLGIKDSNRAEFWKLLKWVLLRRSQMNSNHSLQVGRLKLIRDEMSAFVDGEEIPLMPKEFQILYKLLSYLKKIFTRSELLNDYWAMTNDSGLRSVDVYITKLRKKFAACDSFEIQTIHGFGYKAVLKES